MKHEELAEGDRALSIGPTRFIDEFHLSGPISEQLHDRAHLAAEEPAVRKIRGECDDVEDPTGFCHVTPSRKRSR